MYFGLCLVVKEFRMWKELAPSIHRQRMIIEGTLLNALKPEDMSAYVMKITKVLNMTYVTAPILNYDEKYGWCAYMHWKESGIHMYAWDNHKPPFFSIDIYTCKKFDPSEAVEFTKIFLGENLIDIAWKE